MCRQMDLRFSVGGPLFFFSSRRRHTRCLSDWSSDVCSSDLRRLADQAAIVYCLSRRETEDLASWLAAQGLKAAHYHAGMDANARRHTQEAFAEIGRASCRERV